MDWTAIGAIGEVLGAAAVVASLLYVGRQVKQNALALGAEAQRNAIGSFREISFEVVRDPTLMDINFRGSSNLANLDEGERLRFFYLTYNFLKAGEQVHYLYTNGELDEDTWSGLRTVFHSYASSPGVQAYWEERQSMFSRRFAEFVEKLQLEGGALRFVSDISQGSGPVAPKTS